jgi:soluble lytic murein transglycosylase
MRFLLICLLIAPWAAPEARADEPMLAAIRADQWAQADTLAAGATDPLVGKLATYYRLLTQGAARATELASFMAANPDWPNQALLSRRLQEALAVEKDDGTVLEICRNQSPQVAATQQAAPSMLRCAEAASRTGAPDADSPARRAWVAGITDAPGEAAFLKRWGGQITPDDQWRRFDRLAWTDNAAPGGPAARQAARLPPGMRAIAEARLALKRDDPAAPALFAALPESSRADPALVFEMARWRRRAGQDQEAARLWSGPGVAAEQAAPAERRSAFWDERNLLTRRLLRANDPAQAYAVAAAPAASADGAIDSAFLAGWIALRRLNQPGVALRHFTALASLSNAAITQARAHYWLGRAQDAGGSADAARAEYSQAAGWPTTYYGQLAALSLGEAETGLAARVAAAQDPAPTDDQAQAFLKRDGARAAVLLAAWGEPRRARPFIQRLDELAATATDRALAARLALGLGLPDQAVAVARRAGRDGVMLPGAGWPTAAQPPDGPVEQAVVLGLIRQESSFDVAAMSPVGARGLMQLMPATAAGVAKRLGVAPDLAALTVDAGFNMRLGTTYLQGLLTQFGQALPLAIAGYNAGPHRVTDWLAGGADPVADPAAMIDWIEMIPFNETRNYVQRVVENIVIYRARLGTAGPHPVLRPASP